MFKKNEYIKLYSLFIAIILFNNSGFCQIKSLKGFEPTIQYLHGSFKLDSFNINCATCYDCRKIFIEDSLIRLDTINFKGYIGSRVFGACTALQKLQNLLLLDSLLQEKTKEIELKYKSDNDSLYSKFIQHHKSWYSGLEFTLNYFSTMSMRVKSGILHEQIDLVTIMVKYRLKELIELDALFDYEKY